MYFPECPADLWRVVHHNCQQPYIVHRDLWSCWGFHHATRRQSKQCPTLVLGIFKNVHHGSGKIEMPLRCQRILKTIWWGKFGLGMWWNLVYFFFFERQCWEGGQSIRRFICILCMLLDPIFLRDELETVVGLEFAHQKYPCHLLKKQLEAHFWRSRLNPCLVIIVFTA